MVPSFALFSPTMQPLLTLVSGCQQTVALTFLTNELFRFNDPFCRKNKKIAEIIATGGEGGGCKRAAPTHTLYFYSPTLLTAYLWRHLYPSNNASSLSLCLQGVCDTSTLSRKWTDFKKKYPGCNKQVMMETHTPLCVCESDTLDFFSFLLQCLINSSSFLSDQKRGVGSSRGRGGGLYAWKIQNVII